MKKSECFVLILLVQLLSSALFAQPLPPGGGGCTNCPPYTNIYIPPPYVPGLKLAIPTPSGTNLFINLLEADPAGTYDIFAASNLIPATWNDILSGTNGQTNFTLMFPFTDMGFFRAARTDTPVVNTAGMTAYFLNNDVNTNLISAIISGGPAAAMAVLVNDTNLADAVWLPFSAVPYVLLGTNDGTYQVEFGFIGSDGQTNWTSAFVTLDTTPPPLFITGPTNGIVTQPVIQLTGYSPEALSSVNYDITNAGGLVTNQSVFVLDQFYDTNILQFTTNTFQAFDVPLTNGLNIITLHATDLVGNVTTLATNITLDYSSKTNPPVMQVNWPQDEMEICGTNFTCNGSVSDPTASITVQVVDINGDTNVLNAVVGRDGKFWAEDMPLSSGTNYLALTATDAAGNTATTNLTVVQGDIGLAIDSVSAGQTTVTGEINSSDYTIWVNGVKGTNNGDGTWTVQIASIGIGGGTVEAMAIPNSDNGGNGSGSLDLAGNPNSAQAQGAQTQVEAPSGVYISSFHEFDQIDYLRVQTNYPQYGFYYPGVTYTTSTSTKWANGNGGNGHATEYWSAFDWTGDFAYLPDSGLYAKTTTYNWPATSWPQSLPDGTYTVWKEYFGVTSPVYQCGGPNLAEKHCKFINNFIYPPLVGNNPTDQKITADAKIILATGGRIGSTKMNLWVISATATPFIPPWPFDDGWQTSLVIASVANVVRPIPLQNISILGKTLGSDGNLYLLLPDNANLDATPTIAGAPDCYTFTVTAQKYGYSGNFVATQAEAFS